MNNKLNGFSLIEVIIIIILLSIFLSIILFAQKNILFNITRYNEEQTLINDAKEYIYYCQAKNEIINITNGVNVTKIKSNYNIETYKYYAEKGGSKIEITFSIKKK